MLIGKRVEIAAGGVEILVDEADFDGPFTVVLTPASGSPMNIGDATVTNQEGGFRLDAGLTLRGVVDSVYAANVYPLSGGGNGTVNVLAYSAQED